MSPLEDVEADLMEAKKQFRLWKQYKIHRTFLTGANPFVLKFDRLMTIAALIKKYFPENQTIGRTKNLLINNLRDGRPQSRRNKRETDA